MSCSLVAKNMLLTRESFLSLNYWLEKQCFVMIYRNVSTKAEFSNKNVHPRLYLRFFIIFRYRWFSSSKNRWRIMNGSTTIQLVWRQSYVLCTHFYTINCFSNGFWNVWFISFSFEILFQIHYLLSFEISDRSNSFLQTNVVFAHKRKWWGYKFESCACFLSLVFII